MDDRLEQFEHEAREWVLDQVARLNKFLQESVPVVQEAAERVVDTIREKLPAVQEAFNDVLDKLVDELRPADPPTEEDEARRGIGELEDYLRDR